MKQLIIAAAIVATSTMTIADVQADGKRKYRPQVVQCVEPEQGHVPTPFPPAYKVALMTADGRVVTYTIDNQFAQINQARNLPQYYDVTFDQWVVGGIETDCFEDEGMSCTLFNFDEMRPAPRPGWVNPDTWPSK